MFVFKKNSYVAMLVAKYAFREFSLSGSNPDFICRLWLFVWKLLFPV